MLLAGAGLLLKSLKRVIETPIGVEVERLSAVGLWPPSDRYAEPARLLAFYRAVLEAIQRVPGVTSVALVNHVPLGGASMPTTVSIEGRDPPKDQLDQANFRTVSPSYFEVAGIPVIRGRTFTEADLAGPNGGLVVNRAFADRYWPGQDPIGRRVTIYKSARWLPDFGQPLPSTVIGVVGDVRHFGPETSPAQEVYLPYTWNPWQWGNLMIRSSLSPEALRDPVRRALLAIEPDLPVEGAAQRFETFDQRLVELRAPRRLLTVGLAGLAGTALAIAMVGLSAILAYHVTRRRAELGIRAALGASRAQVLGLVMKEGLALTGIGVAIGLVGSLLSSQVLASLLFGVSARDVGVFLLVPLVLFAVATVAVYHPARRAAKVDPVETMR
jgi:predicted permease